MTKPSRHLTAVALAITATLLPLPVRAQRLADNPFTDPPPATEPAEIGQRIDEAAKALASGAADASAMLADPARLDLHEWPRFRDAIRRNPARGTLTMVTPDEPGPRLVVTGTVRTADGKPAAGALLYLYQTSARGWYSDRAAHYRANSGDMRHARLFGYVRAGDDGRYEVRTIRPEGYPGSDLPRHIHVHVSRPPGREDVTEIQFEDDPRLTAEQRESSRRGGFHVRPVAQDKDGTLKMTADFVVP